MNQEKKSEASLYAHLSASGKVFIIPSDTRKGLWTDLSCFKTELHRLKDLDGLLLLSMEEEPLEEETQIEVIREIINEFKVRIQNVPIHPAVSGYHRSFARSLWDAVDRAREDVEGTKYLLEDSEYWLTQVQNPSSDYQFWEEARDRLKNQLKYAEHALQKLKDLELELTHDPEGGEN